MTTASLSQSPPLLELARSYALLLAGSVVAGAVAALSWAALQPRLYEASTTLLVVAGDASPAAQAAAITNARNVLENRSIASKVIAAHGLGGPPERLTPDQLIVERLRVAQVRDTRYLQVALRLGAAEKAQAVLRDLVQQAVALSTALVREETNSPMRTLLNQQADDARAHLREVSERVLVLRRSTRVEELRGDVNTAIRRRARLQELDALIAAEDQRLARAQSQLTARPRSFDAARGDGAALLEHRRRQPPAAPVDTAPSLAELRGEKLSGSGTATTAAPPAPDPPPLVSPGGVDPVYQVLDYEAAVTRTRIAALQGERAALLKSSAVALDRLYSAEAELTQLEVERALAEEAFMRLKRLSDATRESAMSRSLYLYVADEPIASAAPAAPRMWLSGVLGGLGGLCCGLAVVFLRWRRPLLQS